MYKTFQKKLCFGADPYFMRDKTGKDQLQDSSRSVTRIIKIRYCVCLVGHGTSFHFFQFIS